MKPWMMRALWVVALAMHFVWAERAWDHLSRRQDAADLASYYYAAEVALQGENPYVRRFLSAAAREDGTRVTVHPYFYPPPALLWVLWMPSMSLVGAWRLWFWIDLASGILAFAALARWWRPLGPAVGVTLAGLLAAMTALPNNHVMGQINLLVLLLVVLGLWAEERGRWGVAGALLGVACMTKMSPAVFVAWWLLRWRWKAPLVAVFTALLTSLLALPVVGWEAQLDFYTRVLPGFANGRYNGLAIPIGLFGNHSLPDLFHAAFPSRPGAGLSPIARELARISAAGLLGVLAVAFWWEPKDRVQVAGQLGAVGVFGLLIPVYTYEHHLVMAVPAIVAGAAGWAHGRLGRGWELPWVFAVLVLCVELQWLKAFAEGALAPWPTLAFLVEEAKFVALFTVGLISALVGRTVRAKLPPSSEAS